ncbi:MAG TPA: tetratricopeptide repeat protein [Pyrinomonadaceae bacterium]|jgi:tetratricopeptide (TPR) repeat protein
MRKIFIASFFVGAALLQIGCHTAADNTNQGNSSTGTNAANTNTGTAVQSTPLPEFTDAETAFATGDKLFDANKTELAIEAYTQAVKLNPDFADAWFKLGVSYALVEKLNEVESLNEEIPEATPTPARKRKNTTKKETVIRTKDSEKAFEKAVAAYKKIVAKNKEDDAAFYNLGRSYNKLDEDDDAEKALREAVKLKPDETLYQTELGAIEIKLAHYDEAVKALKKALELDPENSEAAELLDKAEAGKKRIDFGVTPKPPQQTDIPKSDKTRKPSETESPEPNQTPENQGKPVEPKPNKTPEKKMDKKGDQ